MWNLLLRPIIAALVVTTLLGEDRLYPILLVRSDDGGMPAGVTPLPSAAFPSNIVAPATLQRALVRMSNQSRTFRWQCARIAAAPRLLVRVHTAAPVTQSAGGAMTEIRQSGVATLEADVYLAGVNHLIELISHEFEHIIEQLDGVDLAQLARLAPATVWSTGGDRFETQRAIRAGRLVAAEVEAWGR